MKSTPDLLIPLLFLTIVALIAYLYKRKPVSEGFANVPMFFEKPNLYWFCDSGVNARKWSDFGGRNSKKPNRGYLTVALSRVRKTQPEFNIVPIVGREDLFAHLPSLDRKALDLPPKLWREFAIANILRAKGGLAMDGDSTLCVGPSFYSYLVDDAATFGINPDEPIASPVSALAPGPAPYVGWSRNPNHPAWVTAANFYNNLVLKGSSAWSAAIARRANLTVWEKQKSLGCVVLRSPDGSRLPNGKPRQLEDIFGNNVEASSTLLPGTVYISYDGDDLSRRYEFNWFLRLSPEQLAESDIVWSKFAKIA